MHGNYVLPDLLVLLLETLLSFDLEVGRVVYPLILLDLLKVDGISLDSLRSLLEKLGNSFYDILVEIRLFLVELKLREKA